MHRGITLIIKKISAILIFAAVSGMMFRDSIVTYMPRGPLFIQLHYTSRITNISSSQLFDILNGRISNYSQVGGSGGEIKLFCDSPVCGIIREKYPRARMVEDRFRTNLKLQENRSFFGISDAGGLMPGLKILYIDKKLPWGRLNDDYSLDRNVNYRFMGEWAMPWINEKLISVVQTGVTAMTRSFIPAVNNEKDLSYPVRYTKNIISRADIAMTSNEVSFLDPCTYPLKDNLTFCTPKNFFNILKDSGFNVIELTGNHNNDFGRKYNTDSMNMILDAGMNYFGGGKNRAEAEKILYLTVKGIKIAFIGFNEIGPKLAWATESEPGAAVLKKEKLYESVKEAAGQADVVFLSIQWGNENEPRPDRVQKEYFRRAAELGATIIVSSSAHRAMGMEFYNGKFISYGFGNFLFDQMHTIDYRRGIIARHFIYNARHVQTELIPYMIYNCSQPRLLSGREAQSLYDEVFRLSLGNVFR